MRAVASGAPRVGGRVRMPGRWFLPSTVSAGCCLAGLEMPGLGDIEPRPFGEGEHVPGPNARKDHNTPVRTLDSLRRRAAAIDKALDGHPAPAPADYLRRAADGQAKPRPGNRL